MKSITFSQPPTGTGASEYVPVLFPPSNGSSQAVAVVYLVAVAALGTGGVPGVDWNRANARTGPFTIVREGAAEETFTTADRVLLLRRWFSLSVAEAARVLHVKRPTIYSWQHGKAPAAPKNLGRLRNVFELANEWRAISAEPMGNHRKEPLGPAGRTLVDLLSEDDISRARVSATMARAAVAIARHHARRPMSGAELAKRLGFKQLSEADVVANVARESVRGSRKSRDP